MEDVRNTHKLCHFSGCKRQGHFSNARGRFCKRHAPLGMPSHHSICEVSRCTTQPSFNFPGETCGVRCKGHRELGMVGVTSRRCGHPGCTIRPSFSAVGETGRVLCVKHKDDDMVNTVNRTCEFDGCTIQPIFNFPEHKRGRFCCNSLSVNYSIGIVRHSGLNPRTVIRN